MSYIVVPIIVIFCVILVGLCIIYLVCKRQILQHSRAFDARQHRNTRLCRTMPSRHTSVITIGPQVQPPMPPPYDNLPPPYFTVDYGKSEKKDDKTVFPDEPPPAYSPYDTGVI